MRTDLDHLPANKQRELERVVEILFEEFGDATAGRKKLGRIRNRLHTVDQPAAMSANHRK